MVTCLMADHPLQVTGVQYLILLLKGHGAGYYVGVHWQALSPDTYGDS